MSVFSALQQIDENLLIYLNSLGNETWDSFWLTVTDQFFWWWFYLMISAIIIFKLGWRRGLIAIILIILGLVINDQFINFIKELTGRSRPCNVAHLQEKLRILKCTPQKSFFSGHAGLSFSFASYFYFLLRNKIPRWFLLSVFIWAFLLAYSRIYIGIHYPSDVVIGMLEGSILGFLLAFLFKKRFGNKD